MKPTPESQQDTNGTLAAIRLYSPHSLQQQPARRRGHRQWLAETASRQMAASLYEFAAIRDCQLAGSDTDLRLVHGHSQPTSGVFVRAAGGRQEIRASP